jgi:hypothetical protein
MVEKGTSAAMAIVSTNTSLDAAASMETALERNIDKRNFGNIFCKVIAEYGAMAS